MSGSRWTIGLDVGSTTVKAVVTDAQNRPVWRHYERHETRQAEKALEFQGRWAAEIPGFDANCVRIFTTGSGGGSIATHIGAKFVQEVHAVSLAVEKLYPECGTVIELGGQDAKIIFFQEDPLGGPRRKLPSMNDKCAGGTGAVIDKIRAKLNIPAPELESLAYDGVKVHPVAGKCGVFAETDINGLQKSGVPPTELMASLYEAIVMQNLSVLTRGNTPRPTVLLLGGPNTFLAGLQQCWRHHLLALWRERKTPLPQSPADQLVFVPEGSEYFAALGAIEAGKQEPERVGQYRGSQELETYVIQGRTTGKPGGATGGLSADPKELNDFRRSYYPRSFAPAVFAKGSVVEAYLGLDGGSTSTKAVLLGTDRTVLAKSYQLSGGNPIADTQDVIANLEEQISAQGARLRIRGAGVTGYAKDILKDIIHAEAALVETVAHTQAGLHFFPNVDVICDVGGQDIKIIFLKNGSVKDFRLNTQCSAGNGYFLQSTGESLGFSVKQFADAAFSARAMPEFGYGCAVFMQSDIVNFQRQGWRPEEIMAGLCHVLPKNIWLYVAQVSNLASFGRTFLLQGGTQHNLAAVKAQVDFIRSRFRGEADTPDIIVHPHCGEAGAIGAALEAGRRVDGLGEPTTFIGAPAVGRLQYKSTRSEATRCYFCPNHCLRTFIDVTDGPKTEHPPQRVIVATCEKGTVENVQDMRRIKGQLDQQKDRYPNLADFASRAAFRVPHVPVVPSHLPRFALTTAQRERRTLARKRVALRIAMPRVLNMYSLAPLFNAYFVALGIAPENILWSDVTSEELYKAGAKRGAIDPCFPSKLGIPHIHHLLEVQHARKPFQFLFFPMVDCLPTNLSHVQASRACPTVTATPESVKAAFTRETNLFSEKGVQFINPVVDPGHPELFGRQMIQAFGPLLGLHRDEHQEALTVAYQQLARFEGDLRAKARQILDELEVENRVGIVLLGRPYHNDPGVNHGIPEEFQKLGYPVLTQDSLPLEEPLLERLFGDEIAAGSIPNARAISDVWKNSYSENTSRKVWAAKFVARHPNLIGLELSNFKCGHDAPIYSVTEKIIEAAGKPFFSFRDLDENRPTGAIRIRTETIAYFLSRYQETLNGFANVDMPQMSMTVQCGKPEPELEPAFHVAIESLLS